MMVNVNWNKLIEECVGFTQRLIQTPSMSYEEEEIAQLIAREMEKLGFSDVWLDEIGNVCGKIDGKDSSLGALVLNSHLDHVDPGDPEFWPVPPYSAHIVDNRIIGRGAADIKGPLAVQIYAMSALIRAGIKPRRDVVFVGVVQEEVGGAGAKYWVEHVDYPVELAVLGEPSSNHIALGHRGLYQLWVKFLGRSAHASVPDLAENPNYALASFLEKLRANQNDLSSHPLLGPTTVAPTVIDVDTKSPNVTPGWARVALDFRSASESPKSLQEFIYATAKSAELTHKPVLYDLEEGDLIETDELLTGFYTPPEEPIVGRILQLITDGMGWKPEYTSYRFATDGRFFTPHGLTVLGFSPAEEELVHTSQESISISMMADSLHGHYRLLIDL